MPSGPTEQSFFHRHITLLCILGALVELSWLASPRRMRAETEAPASMTWRVSIVLPRRVVAGERATLAVLGARVEF